MNFIYNITANDSLRYLLISLTFVVLFFILAGIYNLIISTDRLKNEENIGT